MRILLALCALCLLIITIGLLGLITGLIILGVAVLISPFIIFAYKHRQARAATTGGGTGTATNSAKKTDSGSSNFIWGVLIILILSTYIYFALAHGFHWWPFEVQQATTSEKYVITWKQAPDDLSGDPNYRSNENVPPMLVDILDNNENYFRFIVTYMHKGKQVYAHFSWDKKHAQVGTWYQAEPASHGTWSLEKDLDIPGRFNGFITDEKSPGQKILKLEKKRL